MSTLRNIDSIKEIPCDQCNVIAIGGTATHELGCPNFDKNPLDITEYTVKDCHWCWSRFKPYTKTNFCSEDCNHAYNS